jgi:hypothetical protein
VSSVPHELQGHGLSISGPSTDSIIMTNNIIWNTPLSYIILPNKVLTKNNLVNVGLYGNAPLPYLTPSANLLFERPKTITENPTSDSDFTPLYGTAAIDAGVAIGAPFPTTDRTIIRAP